MTVRFIHTADWQLGMTRHFLSPEAQARFTQARIDGIRTIGNVAREEGASFVVVAGDVFESNQLEPRTVRRTIEACAPSAFRCTCCPATTIRSTRARSIAHLPSWSTSRSM